MTSGSSFPGENDDDDIANIRDLEGFDEESLQAAAAADLAGDSPVVVFKEAGGDETSFKRS